MGQRLCGHSRGEGRAKSADSAGGSAELPKRAGPGRAGHAAHKPKGHRGPTAQMRGADGTERDSEEARPARATAPEPAERGSDEASESLGAAQDNRRVGKARQRVEEQRRREGRNRKSPEKGTEKPSYRSERDPAAPDMRRTSQRGTRAPWRRCGRTDGAERDSEEERPVPTTGPRFRTREPAPRPVPPVEREADRRSGAETWQERPRRRRRDRRRRIKAFRHQTESNRFCNQGGPAFPGRFRVKEQQYRTSREKSTRRAYGRTAARPKTGADSLGLPKRTRTGFVARLCARRPGGCRCLTRNLPWKRTLPQRELAERGVAERSV